MKDYILDEKVKAFTTVYCEQLGYINRWCNGKHIPKIKTKNIASGLIFTGKDISKVLDVKPCPYYQNKKCMHPRNPKNRKDKE